jgi:hypothetical protein
VFTDDNTVTFINNMQNKSQINEMEINVARISAENQITLPLTLSKWDV